MSELGICSDEGLTLETSAFQSLYGGQFTLSTPLINQIFVFPCYIVTIPSITYTITSMFSETSSPKISTVHRSLKLLQSGSFPVDVGTNVTTVTGNTLSIRCNATGIPVPQITWSKGGSLLDAKGPVYILSLLTSSDSGLYQCTATNVDGAVNQDIRIDVLGKLFI